MCKLAIKVEKNSKNKRPFSSSYSQSSTKAKSFAHPKLKTAQRRIKARTKARELLKNS